MGNKMGLLVAALFFISTTTFAQKELSAAEVQNFTKLIQDSKQYYDLKVSIDSYNTAAKMEVEDIKISIFSKDQSAAADDYIFTGNIKRMFGGASLQTIWFSYDKRKKQLVPNR